MRRRRESRKFEELGAFVGIQADGARAEGHTG